MIFYYIANKCHHPGWYTFFVLHQHNDKTWWSQRVPNERFICQQIVDQWWIPDCDQHGSRRTWCFFFENHDRRVQFCKMHAGIKQSFADAGESTGSQQEKIFRNHTLVLLQNFVNNFGLKYVTHDVKQAYLDWRLHFALPRGIDCPMYQFPQHHCCTNAEKQRMASRVELYRGLFWRSITTKFNVLKLNFQQQKLACQILTFT